MPWQSALDNLHYYYLMLDRTDVYQPMQVDYISHLLQWQKIWFEALGCWRTGYGVVRSVAFFTHCKYFFPGLFKEGGDSPLLALQEFNVKLDCGSKETYWPVSTLNKTVQYTTKKDEEAQNTEPRVGGRQWLGKLYIQLCYLMKTIQKTVHHLNATSCRIISTKSWFGCDKILSTCCLLL